MREELIDRVLLAATLIPKGRVASYGDLAELVGTGPRVVGAIMSRYGHDCPWWRVTNSYGDLPSHVRAEAWRIWRLEKITVKPNGLGCRIADYRCDLPALADAYESALGPEGSPVAP